jgi:hypothetical protein
MIRETCANRVDIEIALPAVREFLALFLPCRLETHKFLLHDVKRGMGYREMNSSPS